MRRNKLGFSSQFLIVPFVKNRHGGLLDTSTPARFSWRPWPVNARPRAERPRTAHKQKKEPHSC